MGKRAKTVVSGLFKMRTFRAILAVAALISAVFISGRICLADEALPAQAATATAIVSPVGPPVLLIIKPFTSKSTKRYAICNCSTRTLKNFLALNLASKYSFDSRMKTVVAISTPEEEDTIENAVFRKAKSYKRFEDIINLDEVMNIAAKNNARLVLLTDIKEISAVTSREEEKLGGYKITKNYVSVTVELATLIYDIQKKEIIHNKYFKTQPIRFKADKYNDSVKAIEEIMGRYERNSPPQTINEEFKQEVNEFFGSPVGEAVASAYSQMLAAVTPRIYDTFGIKTDAKADILILSASVLGNDVRLFTYSPDMKNFDANMPYANVYDTIPNYKADGVNVAAGDFDGDGHDELVIAAGYDMDDHEDANYKHDRFKGSYIVVLKRRDGQFDKTNPFAILRDFQVEKKGGSYVTAGDFDGDGDDELVASQTMWYDTIKVFDYKNGKFDTENPFAVISKTFSEGDTKPVGAFVAAGDFDGDGADELVVSESRASRVKVFDFASGAPVEIADMTNLYENYDRGVFVASGNFDGDSTDELIVSKLAGDDDVKVLSYRDGAFDTQNLFARAFDKYPGYNSGVFITAGDYDGCGRDELVIGSNVYNDVVTVFK